MFMTRSWIGVGRRELADPPEMLGVIDAGIERNVVVEATQVVAEKLDAGEHALADRDVRDDDNELRKPVALVQLEDRAQVDVGLAGTGLHLDREVQTVERLAHGDSVALLHGSQIREQSMPRKATSSVGVGLPTPSSVKRERRRRLRRQRERLLASGSSVKRSTTLATASTW